MIKQASLITHIHDQKSFNERSNLESDFFCAANIDPVPPSFAQGRKIDPLRVLGVHA
jgi:hypothetical protein